MVLNTQQYHPIKSKQPRKTMQDTTAKRKIRHTPIVQQTGIHTNVVKTLIILISTSNKTNTGKLRNSRGKKDRGCPKQLYEAIIPI